MWLRNPSASLVSVLTAPLSTMPKAQKHPRYWLTNVIHTTRTGLLLLRGKEDSTVCHTVDGLGGRYSKQTGNGRKNNV